MSENKKCVVCKNEVKWDTVVEEFDHLFVQADSYGVESLTEQQQVVLEGRCCCQECFENLA